MVSLPALAAETSTGAAGAAAGTGKIGKAARDVICDLAVKLQDVFVVFRTLAFVGAGIMLAKWGWGLITKGEEFKSDDAQKKLISILAGTIILFSIGILLSALLKMTGEGGSLDCVTTFFAN